jgi:hypothetical protein
VGRGPSPAIVIVIVIAARNRAQRWQRVDEIGQKPGFEPEDRVAQENAL